ncbi:MAG: S9 family peptidase, partial [Asticcacaulis sp.]|nr:S9 family peptidase [Asticcacaulis sp.]
MSLIIVAALAVALQTAPTVHRYEALTLSPDGSRISTFEVANGGTRAVVTIRNADGAVIATSDPCNTCRYGDAAWSPDGKVLAVVASDGNAGTNSLYVVEGATVRLLASVKGTLDAVRWSPDGKAVAVLAVENAHKLVGATQAGAKQVGEIGTADVTDEQRIAIVPAAGGALKMVSPGDTWVYEYDWTPDGQGFVATAAKGDGDNNWWTAKLESFALAGQERVIAAPKMQMNYPRMSPDGKSVYIVGGLMSDFPVSGGDVFAVPFSGGEPVNLTPDYKGTFTSLVSTKGGLLASLVTGGEVGLARVDAKGVTPLSHAEISMAAADARFAADSAGKTMAAVVESFDAAPHIVRGPLSAPVAVTHDNDAIAPQYVAKSVTWTNEGFTVQGWLMGPKTEAGKTYPMVTVVHGGPSAAITARFTTSGSAVDLVKAGYFVFQPNPRGSYGQGEAFVLSNRRDFGGGDLRDILAGIDAVEKIAPVDDKRLGIMGHSYGGLMTMWTVTHSQRFKAAVSGAGIA